MKEIVEELIVDLSATGHGGNRGSFQRVQGAAVYGYLIGVFGGWMGVFGLFSRSSGRPGRPGVSASFSSPRALIPVSARGLLPISFLLLSGSLMCGQTHMLMSFQKNKKQPQQQHKFRLRLHVGVCGYGTSV